MAKKNTTAAAVAPAATNGNAEQNRSKMIRDYAAANPNAKVAEIIAGVKKEHSVEVSSSLVSSVLSRGSASSKVDVDSIKMAASFIKGFKGGISEAKAAIETVGGFVEECGSASKAVAALDAYEALAGVLLK
jgi:hypothetical protein